MFDKIVAGVAAGAAAGAAGTTALNAVTYADMAWRGRPSSSTPGEAVERLAKRMKIAVPGDDEQRGNRVSGLGALSGLLTGVAVGAAYGAVRALGWRPPVLVGAMVTTGAAMAGANGSLMALGVTDPRRWSGPD
jgi:hypothetical protein